MVQTSLDVDVRYDPSGELTGAVDRTEPPNVVMQTGITDPKDVSFSLNPVSEPLLGSGVYRQPSTILIFPSLYLGYYNKSAEEYRAFDFTCTDLFYEYGANLTVLPPALSTTQYSMNVVVNSTFKNTNCSIFKNQPIMIDPIINAAEFFTAQAKNDISTSSTDGTCIRHLYSNVKVVMCLELTCE